MRGLLLVSVLVSVTSSERLQDDVSTCSDTLCTQGFSCYEIFNKTSGAVLPSCQDNTIRVTPGVCKVGAPLLTTSPDNAVVEASCGFTPDSLFTCPVGFHCNTSPSSSFAVCCRSSGLESGECPAIREDNFDICISNCITDTDCTGGFKCCKNSCGGLLCQAPVVVQPVLTCQDVKCQNDDTCKETNSGPKCFPARKVGACPTSSFSWSWLSRHCHSECEVDGDCPGFLKCCYSDPFNCNRRCQVPEPLNTCQTQKCPHNQSCVMQETKCDSLPCFPVPVCIQTASRCSSSCPVGYRCQLSNESCVSENCPETPRCVPEVNVCNSAICPSGFECVAFETQCWNAPCEVTPICRLVVGVSLWTYVTPPIKWPAN